MPVIASNNDTGSTFAASRTPDARLDEAVGLAGAIDLEITDASVVPIPKVRPSTLFGSGKTEEIATHVKSADIELVIVDHTLTPVQQRNLEKAFGAKVLDRTGLILEIFGRRAQTKEGVIQVDLAHLNYQKGRLVRSWTHLERQRGGAGFLGGPGETQIEADRRLLQEKINRLKKQLEKVRRTRGLHRQKRKKVPYPIVAIVGYTNAGKSTLFNQLTGAGVLAEDQLFATLDPTIRQLKLPGGTIVLLSDTVGFISDLPTHLIAAFRATLEEVVEADVILHVRDFSDPDRDAQASDVRHILTDLNINPDDETRIIEVLNKIDALDTEQKETAQQRTNLSSGPETIAISAITGEGFDKLLATIERLIAGNAVVLEIKIAPEDHHLTGWLYESGKVITRTDNDEGVAIFTVRTNEQTAEDIQRRFLSESRAGQSAIKSMLKVPTGTEH